MRIAPKLSITFILAALLPLIAIGCAGMYLLANLGDTAIATSRANAIISEKLRLQQLAADKARIVEDFLADHHRDVLLLKRQFERLASDGAALPAGHPKPYAGRDTAGLPGYGFVDTEARAYANWNGLGTPGGLWLRRGLVERVRSDAVYAQRCSAMLDRLSGLMPLMDSLHEKHLTSCDLVWIVTTLGPVAVSPDEYAREVRRDPGLADFDETREEYHRPFTPENNPKRETRWMRPYLDVIKNIWMTSCVAPLYDGDTFQGTVGFDVTIENLLGWLKGLQIGNRGFAFLISAGGMPLAIPTEEIDRMVRDPLLRQALREAGRPAKEQHWTPELGAVMQRSIAEDAPPMLTGLYASMMRQGAGADVIDFPDGNRIIAYCPIRETGWSIGLALPIDEALAPLRPVLAGIDAARRRYVFGFVGFVLLSALAAGLAGAWAGRRLANPVNALIAAISRISRGDAWLEIRADTQDELQELATSANVMVRRIAENEQMLDAVFNGVSDAIFLHDADGLVLRVNDRMCSMFQCTRDQALAANVGLTSINEPPYTGYHAKLWLDRAFGGDTPVFEWRSRDFTGRLFWTEVALRRIDLNGKPCIIATVRDISSRKEAEEKLRLVEEQLRQAQKLESIGRLAGGVAHDFNNMLTPILGYAHILRESLGDPKHRAMLEQITLAGGRCRALVSQLLAFARKQVLTMRSICLNEVIREFQPMLRRTLRENITIEYRLAERLEPIRGDAGQLQQVILNLALNSQDAMPEGGVLTCETALIDARKLENVDLPPTPTGRFLLLTVSDTGAGMERETLEHLFEPFFTTHGQGEGCGTGLGLSIVHGIMMQHGGRVRVSSTPGKGTVMQLYFPVATGIPAGEQQGEEGHAVIPRGTGRILVVEDQEMVRQLAVTLLGELGYRTFAASNGTEAIELFRGEQEGEPIDLVLMDVILPDMSGPEVVTRLRDVGDRPVRVLYMSGYMDSVIGAHGVLDPGVHFLRKPFDIRSLAESVRKALL
ncbi:MAG TPA: ATP-binding protein [Candidatus Ozemobacteraceae bacterium]|nr:ATP-binding protein [Candidatus Ozemobacteraceae bacterium]